MSKHTLLTRDEALRARELIRERLGHDRYLKIDAAALFAKSQREGMFTGYASTFGGEPDLAGDVVAPGAFAQSIKRLRRARGTWPPLLWQHDTSIRRDSRRHRRHARGFPRSAGHRSTGPGPRAGGRRLGGR